MEGVILVWKSVEMEGVILVWSRGATHVSVPSIGFSLIYF
jgi:hypothetical protein